MLSRLDCHCESLRAKQSVYFDTKFLFIFFLFFLLSFTPFNNLHSQTLQPNPDSIPFAPAVNYPAGDGPWSIFCADLDGDSDLDLAVANRYSGNVSILKNNGNGIFQTKIDYTTGDSCSSVFCADLDGDLDLDLAIANWGSDNVSILKNNGDGTFLTKVDYEAGHGSRSVFCADLDGDSDLDLAVANWGDLENPGSTVSILKNNGDGAFQPKIDYEVNMYPRSVFCADLDGDLDLDLAVTYTWGTAVSMLKNNGDGTFETPVNYYAGIDPRSVFCADLDGDLYLDLAVANFSGQNISILKNNRNGTFQTPIYYDVLDYPISVFCADLDKDSDLDLAVAYNSSDKVSILKNNGNGSFQEAVNYMTGGYSISVFCADLDGDTDLDLAKANWNSNSVSILKNLTIIYLLLLTPSDKDSLRNPIDFNWGVVTDPNLKDSVRYDLYLSRSIVFNLDSTIVYDSLLDTTYTDSLDIKTWYWKVKAYDKWGATRWSDENWSFYVYLCGDCNGDGKITVSDVVYGINYLFKGGFAPKPAISGNVNCDDKYNISDVVYLINYLFKGGPKPCQDCL